MAIDYPIRFGQPHDQHPVRVKIINALSTRGGERVFRPTQGTNIEEELNKSNLSKNELKKRVAEELENVLARRVPNITVDDIVVEVTGKDIRATIVYENSDNPFIKSKSNIQIRYAQSK